MACNLIVNGAAGRMGRYVIALASEDSEFHITAAVERAGHPDIGKDAGAAAGAGEIGVAISAERPAQADCMIDFTLPSATAESIKYCVEHKVKLVLATTGLSEEHLKMLGEAAKEIPIVYATNMSVGMNVLFSIVGKAAKMLGEEYDIEIVEMHHRFKKDAPSGSALTLAENIAKEVGWEYPQCVVHGRHGKEALRQKHTIGMHAVRAGDITGKHSVIYSSLGETVTISHEAHNRANFARGALRAAKWLMGKEAGLYSMRDVLGIE